MLLVLYWIESSVGYLGLVSQPKLLDTLISKRNVIEIDYNNTAFSIGIFIVLFAAITTVPLLMLPAKNDFESVAFNGKTMSKWQNIIVTLSLCLVCTILAISVPQISDAITVLG